MTIAPVSSLAPSQLIDATLRAAAGVTGMQFVYVSSITSLVGQGGPFGSSSLLTWQQTHGVFDGIFTGLEAPFADTFDARLLAGAPPFTADAAADPAYAEVPMRRTSGIVSYIGVPLRREGGMVSATLAGIDTGSVPSTRASVRVLNALARIISAEAARDPEVRLHRTASGWEVEQGDGSGLAIALTDELPVAMSLADLVAGDTGDTVPAQRPERPAQNLSEAERLRVQIGQLEHALSARVVIEQAIGVLAQRFSVSPRESFDRIRKSARSRGQRVHDLAVMIVRSSWDPGVVLPDDLLR